MQQDEEVDVWWGSYAGRAMLPELAASLLLTGLLVAAAIWISRRFEIPAGETRAGFYVVAGALWIVQLGRWLYRVAGFNYRLTTKKLYIWWGYRGPHAPPVLLTEVAEVLVEQTLLEGLTGVGRVRIETQQHGPPLVLRGVLQPRHIADEISRCVRQARAQLAPASSPDTSSAPGAGQSGPPGGPGP